MFNKKIFSMTTTFTLTQQQQGKQRCSNCNK